MGDQSWRKLTFFFFLWLQNIVKTSIALRRVKKVERGEEEKCWTSEYIYIYAWWPKMRNALPKLKRSVSQNEYYPKSDGINVVSNLAKCFCFHFL